MITIKETFCSSVLAQINKETKHCALFNDRNVLSLSLYLVRLYPFISRSRPFHRNSFSYDGNVKSVLPLINTNMTVPH